MPRFKNYVPEGVIPAVLLPFKEDCSIDAQAFRRHLLDVGGVDGVTALTLNAHSTEVSSCSFDEQREVLELGLDAVGGRLPIINGIYADGSIEAQRIARMAAEAGASGLLVFPPNVFRNGQRPEMAVEHFRRIAEVTDLPLVLFQYPLAGGMGYPLATLLKIVDAVPSVRAIKDGCASPELHEQHIRSLQALPRPVNVLSTHSAWLFSSLVMGCNGLLSGSGSVIADLQARLYRAIRTDDLVSARALNTRIRATSTVFYAEPRADMHNRMKEALVLLGKLRCAAVRPPLVKLSSAEIQRIRLALIAAGLLAADGGANDDVRNLGMLEKSAAE
ncbi:MAG: dihydrodipicolinate synthase family protein [Burkholderiales bacterium]|nr:dihydrodipicolinate synthase family protein [Burkholderiales bacterium]